MWCAVNRITSSGRVAGSEQRVSVEDALRGVTIEAAYSLKLEDEVGSIETGKRANLTMLDENPLSVDPMDIRDINVWGTVMEGRVLPAMRTEQRASIDLPQIERDGSEPEFVYAALRHALGVAHGI